MGNIASLYLGSVLGWVRIQVLGLQGLQLYTSFSAEVYPVVNRAFI